MKLNKFLILLILLTNFSTLFSQDLTICFTSDVNGHFQESYATWISNTFPPPLGGAASLFTFFESEDHDILLDAGNFLGVAPLGDFSKSPIALELIDIFSYSCLSVGIQDLSAGIQAYKFFTEKNHDLFISSSIVDNNGNFVFNPWKIIKVNNIKVGIFSLISSHTSWFIPTKAIETNTILDEVEAAEIAVKTLSDSNCQLIIMLSQCSYRHDTLLANQVSGIDVIFSGFDGRANSWESPNNHTLLFRIHTDLSSVGILELYLNEFDNIISYSFQEKTLFTDEYPMNENIVNKLEEFFGTIDSR